MNTQAKTLAPSATSRLARLRTFIDGFVDDEHQAEMPELLADVDALIAEFEQRPFSPLEIKYADLGVALLTQKELDLGGFKKLLTSAVLGLNGVFFDECALEIIQRLNPIITTMGRIDRPRPAYPMEVLSTEYWDCNCHEGYIHPRTKYVCEKCRAHRSDQPDSRVEEIRAAGLPVEAAS